MPLQHFMAGYRPNDYSKFDAHNYQQLKKIYCDIQWKNRSAPVLLSNPDNKEISTAINLKEQACEFQHTLSSLRTDSSDNMFVKQSAYSSNEQLVSVIYRGKKDADALTADSLRIRINTFASAQENTGKYLLNENTAFLSPGTHSFDLYSKKKHYQLQFGIGENATNLQVQEKIKNLINKSNLGIKVSLLKDSDSPDFTAVQLTSEATGIPYEGEFHFKITDESGQNDIVSYLGLNDTIHTATDASCIIDDQPFSSYCNTFSYGGFEITLHPQTAQDYDLTQPVTIGLKPNVDSIRQNIDTFIQGYNSFIADSYALLHGTSRFQSSMQKLTGMYHNELSSCGITISDVQQLSYQVSDLSEDDCVSAINGLQDFGNAIIQKVNDVTLDPLEYLDKTVCFYRNPATPFINPYTTSIYSGMLFETYV